MDNDIFSLRSFAAESALRWLRNLANELDRTEWTPRDEAILASDVAVDAFVYTRRRRALHRSAESRRNETSLMDNAVAHHYEQSDDWEERDKWRWSHVLRNLAVHKRLGVRGSPGSGKSFLTLGAAVALARDSAQAIENRLLSPDAVGVPFWISATALADTSLSNNPAMIVVESAIRSLRLLNRGVAAPPAEWLLRKAASLAALVIVDGLDQLERKHVEAFKTRAALLASLPGKLIATCRTLHWDDRKKWLNWPGLEDVELAPFTRREHDQLIDRFLGANEGSSLKRILGNSLPLRRACSSPLLLTFFTLLHADHEDLTGSSRVTGYAQVLRKLLSGDWRNVVPPWKTDEELEESVLGFLENAAYSMFSAAPEANRFTLAQWKNAGTPPFHNLLHHLEQCGVLIPAGFDEVGNRCWSLLHRTFLEFLPARALSRQPQEIWLAEARKHFWYEPVWTEVLTFLAAHLPDATLLIETVRQEDDDVLYSMLQLQVRLVGAARVVTPLMLHEVAAEVMALKERHSVGGRTELDYLLARVFRLAGNGKLSDHIFSDLIDELEDSAQPVVNSAVECLGYLGNARAADILIDLLGNSGRDIKWRAAEAIGRLADPKAFAPLRDMLGSDPFVNRHVADALGQCAGSQDIDALIAILRDSESHFARFGARVAIEGLHDLRAVGPLVTLLGHPNPEVRHFALEALASLQDSSVLHSIYQMLADPEVHRQAAIALGKLGDPRAIEPLRRLLVAERGNEYAYQYAEALGELVEEREVSSFVRLLRDKNTDMVDAAAKALVNIDGARALKPLVRLLRSDDEMRSYIAARALERIVDPSVPEVLVILLQTGGIHTRLQAAVALATLGDDRALHFLLDCLHDDNTDVLEQAAEALGSLSDVRSLPSLLALLSHDASYVRRKSLWAIERTILRLSRQLDSQSRALLQSSARGTA